MLPKLPCEYDAAHDPHTGSAPLCLRLPEPCLLEGALEAAAVPDLAADHQGLQEVRRGTPVCCGAVHGYVRF